MGSPERFSVFVRWSSWAFPLALHLDLGRGRTWEAASLQIGPACFILSWGKDFAKVKA